MRSNRPHLSLARICLESTTGLSIGSGLADGAFDTTLARDGNGLPTLPGPALAGVLRHLYWQQHGEPAMQLLFGQAGPQDEGNPSDLHLSWGALHDCRDRPVEGLLLGDERQRLQADPLLRLAGQSQPSLRDHVRLNHRGAAAGMTKFDRAVLPPGFRFTLELTLWSEQADDPRWQTLLGLLASTRFRLGGATRRGLGGFKLVRVHERRLDLRQEADYQAFAALPGRLADLDGFTEVTERVRQQAPTLAPLGAELRLTPRDYWRFGQGDAPLLEGQPPADLLPLPGPRVVWGADGRGQIEELENRATLLIPGSALKGALAHRTAFHLQRRHGKFAEDMTPESLKTWDPRVASDAYLALFGYASDTGEKERNQAGRLVIDDHYLTLDALSQQVGLVMHNGVDRFTGGVREGVLFGEEMIYGQKLTVTLQILEPDHVDDADLRWAFKQALADLTNGRLPLGAGGSKGHGYCSGEIDWSDGGSWIQGGSA